MSHDADLSVLADRERTRAALAVEAGMSISKINSEVPAGRSLPDRQTVAASLNGAATVTTFSVSGGVLHTSLLAEMESVAMPVLAPSGSNPIPSQNPPGSEPCGAALDDKAAPLFSLDDNSSSCDGVESRNARLAAAARPLHCGPAGFASGSHDSIHDGIPKFLQRNNEPMARGG